VNDRAGTPRVGILRLADPATLTLLLCGVAALVEGFDTQATGVAGPRIIREFALSPAVAGWLFTGGTLGQAIGSIIGGRAADHIGRKWALIVSLLLIGVCSLGTVASTGLAPLFVTRVLGGLGLGGAMPNFITLASETVAPDRRQKLVTLLMAALPLGGTIASVTSLANGIGWGWRTIFLIGGVMTLAIGVLSIWTISDSGSSSADALRAMSDPAPRPEGLLHVLFGGGRAGATLLLWVSFFFTQATLLLMLNWLPSLVVRSGFSHTQASWTQVCFSVGGIFGGYVVGSMQAGSWGRTGVATTYLAIAVALAAAGIAGHVYWMLLLASTAAGVFIIGSSLGLYGRVPLYYGRPIRASGVGAAATAGRVGSAVGPLFAGLLLAGGGNTATVLLGIEPFVLIGGAAALALCWCRQARD
jgi:MFS transporter, AAHS family, 3-hydroxyphenylpropionic acid transporter